jgi:hypothetical protein
MGQVLGKGTTGSIIGKVGAVKKGLSHSVPLCYYRVLSKIVQYKLPKHRSIYLRGAYCLIMSPFFAISPTRKFHSSVETLLTLILVNFNICIFSRGCPFSPCHAFSSLSVMGVLSFCRKATCTTDHLGLSGEEDGSW